MRERAGCCTRILVTVWRQWRAAALFQLCLFPLLATGQIDPVKRELVQLGANVAFQGHAPLAAYAFYYRNEPDFLGTNMALRLAVAPTYLDGEVGFRNLLGQNTDLGVGLGGGGFADSYAEIRRGQYMPDESFSGHAAELNATVYHLFNPGSRIPLYGLVRGIAHYSVYARDEKTDPHFRLPDDHGIFSVRSGLRWGGREPTLYPSLAMELSAWYQGEFRTWSGSYGFNDRELRSASHLFWGEALLAYTLPKIEHNFYVSLIAGTCLDADRFSSYRLGALLPMVSEFPLSLPGYYYQEISARSFVLLGGNYIIPLDPRKRWNLAVEATGAVVDYLPGLEQPGNWHSGAGGGVFYTSPSWRVMIGYGYGFDAIRSGGRGAHSIGFLLQLDLAHAKDVFYRPEPPSRWRGLQRIVGVLGS